MLLGGKCSPARQSQVQVARSRHTALVDHGIVVGDVADLGGVQLAEALFNEDKAATDTVQFALDHYEISNTRLIETGLARTERLSSIFGYGIIIVLLLIQLAIMWPR